MKNTLQVTLKQGTIKLENSPTSWQSMKEVIKKADPAYMYSKQYHVFQFAKKLIENKYSQSELEQMFL